MPVITEIREQVRKPDRRSVYVDGEYAFSMTADEVVAHGLAVGDEISDERTAALIEELEVRRARDAMLRLLGYRARSESELRGRLREKQFSDAVAVRVIEDLRRMELVDDRRFAESWVQSRLAAGKAGRARLAWELRSRGVDRRVVEQSLADVSEEAQFPRALELAQRRHERLRSEEPEAQRRKIASFLGRRGFSYDTIDRVLDEILPPG
ncbi:MAG: RecX family transcriptional regulator [Armatimonadetes bacterium]|nr:RecX family transcriptional regulator [Armatimonadota bacterium]